MPRAITRKLFFPPTLPDGFRWALRLERRREERGGIEKARKEGRGAHGREQVACARWYTENSVGSTWMAQMVGQVECCNLAPVPFLSILFLGPHRLLR